MDKTWQLRGLGTGNNLQPCSHKKNAIKKLRAFGFSVNIFQETISFKFSPTDGCGK